MSHSALQALRAQVRAIEAPGRSRIVSLGPFDAALPWGGLPLACLHEVAGAPGDLGAAIGFAAALVMRIDAAKPVLWCVRTDGEGETGALYAPGLKHCGLDPSRVLLVRAKTTTQVLWAMEEALRAGSLAAVVGEVETIGFAESRRLQLAAEAGGVTALLVVPTASAISGAVTRWQVASRPQGTWRVMLTRARGGAPAAWDVEWTHATADFAVVADLRDGSAEPRPAQAAG